MYKEGALIRLRQKDPRISAGVVAEGPRVYRAGPGDPLGSPPATIKDTKWYAACSPACQCASYISVQQQADTYLTLLDTMSNEKLILLGTHGDYIHSAIFDTESRTIRKGQTTKTEPHPSWLTRHP